MELSSRLLCVHADAIWIICAVRRISKESEQSPASVSEKIRMIRLAKATNFSVPVSRAQIASQSMDFLKLIAPLHVMITAGLYIRTKFPNVPKIRLMRTCVTLGWTCGSLRLSGNYCCTSQPHGIPKRRNGILEFPMHDYRVFLHEAAWSLQSIC